MPIYIADSGDWYARKNLAISEWKEKALVNCKIVAVIPKVPSISDVEHLEMTSSR